MIEYSDRVSKAIIYRWKALGKKCKKCTVKKREKCNSKGINIDGVNIWLDCLSKRQIRKINRILNIKED